MLGAAAVTAAVGGGLLLRRALRCAERLPGIRGHDAGLPMPSCLPARSEPTPPPAGKPSRSPAHTSPARCPRDATMRSSWAQVKAGERGVARGATTAALRWPPPAQLPSPARLWRHQHCWQALVALAHRVEQQRRSAAVVAAPAASNPRPLSPIVFHCFSRLPRVGNSPGAGPSGSVCAFYMAQGGARVALLDKEHFPRDKICGDAVCTPAIRILEVRLTACRPCHHLRKPGRQHLAEASPGCRLPPAPLMCQLF